MKRTKYSCLKNAKSVSLYSSYRVKKVSMGSEFSNAMRHTLQLQKKASLLSRHNEI